ncbi:MAG TPA: outer membrane beta-barrel protein [Longimicrobium sp.]|nr:outer membrane beta-barrel protein [Longimicrobium sp.]
MMRMMVAAALAGTVLQAGVLRAQESGNDGLMIGLHAVPMGIDGVGEEQFSEQGMGLGVTLGYGFNDRIAVYATTDGGWIDYDPDNPAAVDEDYELMTVDLGARVNFGNEFMRMRPFLNAAISAVLTTEGDEELGESTTSGGGLTIGGGFQYFYRYRWAMLLALQATMGAFTDVDTEEETLVFARGIPYSHYRVQVGVMWHP